MTLKLLIIHHHKKGYDNTIEPIKIQENSLHEEYTKLIEILKERTEPLHVLKEPTEK